MATNELKWTRKREWGYETSTYRADTPTWHFHIGKIRNGFWTVRGWGPDNAFLYDENPSLTAAKAVAQDFMDKGYRR